jgi:hypothetical protein
MPEAIAQRALTLDIAAPTRQDRVMTALLAAMLLFAAAFHGMRYPMRWTNEGVLSPIGGYVSDAPPAVRMVPTAVMGLFLLASLAVLRGRRFGPHAMRLIVMLAFAAGLNAAVVALGAGGGKDLLELLNEGWRRTWEPAAIVVPLLLWNRPDKVLRIVAPLGCAAVMATAAYDVLMAWNYYANGVYPAYTSPTLLRLGGLWNEPNAAGAFAACCAVALLYWPAKSWRLAINWCLGATAALAVAAAQSRTAFLMLGAGLALGAALMARLRCARRQALAVAAILAVGGGAALWKLSAQGPLHLLTFEDSYRAEEYQMLLRAMGERGFGELLLPLSPGPWVRMENIFAALTYNCGMLLAGAMLLVHVVIVGRGFRSAIASTDPRLPLLTTLTIMVLGGSLLVPYFWVYPVNLFYWVAAGLLWMLAKRGGQPA